MGGPAYRRGCAGLERAYEHRRKEEEGSGAIAVPWALAQLFEADREVPEVPADIEEAAWKRFHRAVLWDGICAERGGCGGRDRGDACAGKRVSRGSAAGA